VAQTERSVARLADERGALRVERWTRIAIEAARQSGRGDIPLLRGPEPLGDALARVTAPLRITLAPGGEPLFARLRAWGAEEGVALLVGPEGGLDERELELAARAGFAPASLGATVLRTELAGVAALGALVALAALIRQDHGA
jgi:16S rRNA (uracil1498-N3)-methyltransferase